MNEVRTQVQHPSEEYSNSQLPPGLKKKQFHFKYNVQRTKRERKQYESNPSEAKSSAQLEGSKGSLLYYFTRLCGLVTNAEIGPLSRAADESSSTGCDDVSKKVPTGSDVCFFKSENITRSERFLPVM